MAVAIDGEVRFAFEPSQVYRDKIRPAGVGSFTNAGAGAEFLDWQAEANDLVHLEAGGRLY